MYQLTFGKAKTAVEKTASGVLTVPAAVELNSHGNMPLPCFRVDTNVVSYYWIFQVVSHRCISIVIS